MENTKYINEIQNQINNDILYGYNNDNFKIKNVGEIHGEGLFDIVKTAASFVPSLIKAAPDIVKTASSIKDLVTEKPNPNKTKDEINQELLRKFMETGDINYAKLIKH